MKQIYLKAIAMVLMVMGGVGAWAQDDYTEIYKRSLADWTEADLTDWNAGSGVTANTQNGLGATANGTATYVTKTFTVEDNSKIKYEVDWTFQAATGRDANWNWIQFGSFLRVGINTVGSTYSLQVSTDAGTTWKGALETFGNNTFTKHIEVIFDVQTKVLESFIYDGQDKTNLVAGTYNNATFNTVSTGFIRGGSVNWSLNNYIQAITVSTAKKAAANEATYTINYTSEGKTVYSVTGTSVEGATITAEKAINGDDEQHYLIVANEIPSIELKAGENTLNVPVRKPYTATLNVTTTIAGESSAVTTALTETDDKVCAWTYVYPYYVEKEGVYYVADVTTSFGETGTFTDGETIDKSVKYTNADESVIYYGEPNQGAAGTNPAYSNGNTGWITGGKNYDTNDVIRLGELQAGVYKFTISVTDASRNRNVVIGDYTQGTAAFPAALQAFTTAGVHEYVLTLSEPTFVCISGKDQGEGKFNQSDDIDYILVQEVSSTTTTISATGYSTFTSSLALDFTNVEDVTAYYVTASGIGDDVVTLTKVEGTVAAGEGLILVGKGDVEIPVVAEGEALEGNLLVGCATETQVAAAKNKYVLVNNDGTAEFQSLEEHDATIPAGKAYLNAEGINVKDRLRIVFGDDDATAIKNVEVAPAADGIYYNIAGQRVQNPSKGIYIVNGQKVLVK